MAGSIAIGPLKKQTIMAMGVVAGEAAYPVWFRRRRMKLKGPARSFKGPCVQWRASSSQVPLPNRQCVNSEFLHTLMRKLKALWFCCLSMVPPAVGQAFNTLAFVIILYPNHSSLIMPNRSVKEAHMHGSRSIALGCQHSGLGLHEMDTLFPHPFQDGQMNAQKGKGASPSLRGLQST